MELIEEIKKSVEINEMVINSPNDYHINDVHEARRIYNNAMTTIKKLESKLEKERQMVIDAFDIGFKDVGLNYIKGEQYYNETFETK